jgi:hypothetical protein
MRGSHPAGEQLPRAGSAEYGVFADLGSDALPTEGWTDEGMATALGFSLRPSRDGYSLAGI